MDGWNTTFLLGRPIFRGYVSFREGMIRDLCVSGFFLLTMNCAENVRRDCLVIGDYNIHHLNIPGVLY